MKREPRGYGSKLSLFGKRGEVVRAFLGTHLVRSAARFLHDCQLRHTTTPGQRFVTFSFDDGPDPESTPYLLDLLDKYRVAATFFLVGEQAARHPELVRDIADRGHRLGNHTYHHADLWRSSTPDAIRDLRACSRLIDSLTGEMPQCWRPPYGHLTGPVMTWCRRQGIQTVLWDVLAPDASPRANARHMVSSLERRIRPGSIVAMRDSPVVVGQTTIALETLLPRLLLAGWELETLPRSTPLVRAA